MQPRNENSRTERLPGLLAPLVVLTLWGGDLWGGDLAGQDELGRALEGLSADQASVRERAERYVAGHAGVDDFPRLARVAAAGDVEVSTRLARVIGSSDANLELAALFIADSDPALQRVGDEALLRRFVAWNERLSAPGLSGSELQKRLFDASQRSYPYTVRIEFGGALIEHCSALQRETGLPVGITIAEQLFDREPIRETQARFEGHWLSALFILARMYGVGLELHGLPRRERDEDELAPQSGAFLRVAPLSELGARTGLQHMLEWFRTFASSKDTHARRRAAHNLARSGWPGALSWMQERALRHGDTEAWGGLVIAAAHGRRVPSLLRPASLAVLLRRVDAQLTAADPAAHDALEMLLAAYRDAGCLTARKEGEETLSEVLFAGWDALSPAAQALRLALLESLGCGDLEGLAKARAVAGTASAPVELRWQALSAAIHVAAVRGVGAAPPPWPRSESMLAGLDQAREIARAVQQLVKAGIEPDAAWSELRPDMLSAASGLKASMLVWWYGVGQPRVAALYLNELFQTDQSRLAIETLRHFDTRGDKRLAELFDLAHERASDPAFRALSLAGLGLLRFELERGQVMLGLNSPEAFMIALSKAERDEYLDPKDFSLYGALGAWGTGTASFEARAHLLQELKQALGRGGDSKRYGRLAAALEELIRGLFRRGEDATASSIREEIAQITARSPETGLARMLSRGWPPPSRTHLRILSSTPAGRRIRALSQGTSQNGR